MPQEILEVPIPHVALPECHDPPAHLLELSLYPRIAGAVIGEFRGPKFRLGPRQPGRGASLVRVPETSVDEYGRTITRQHDIRLPRKVGLMQPKPPAEAV